MDSNFLFLAAAGGKFINGEMKEGFRRRSLNLNMGHIVLVISWDIALRKSEQVGGVCYSR